MENIKYKGKMYKLSDDKPENYDLVSTNNYGVWV
jgi:hypothetical protein